MLLSQSTLWTTALVLAGTASANPTYYTRYQKRYAYTTDVADSYDFVIVGGGTAGLVLASRLSEEDHTVLVLEAGASGDELGAKINPPGNTYYGGLLHSENDWAYMTVPQPGTGGRSQYWPRGKVLGGCSAVNGMYMTRPSKIEVDAWHDLIAPDDAEAAKVWSWNNFLAGMDKSETFVRPIEEVKTGADVRIASSAKRGSDGPIHVTYPAVTFPVVGAWTKGLQAAGVPVNDLSNPEFSAGVYISPTAINPGNWSRSYAKSGYIDPLPPRRNLHVAVSATVTRIIWDESTTGDLKATAVNFEVNGQATSVKVAKEVILAAGVVGSPQLLMVSGVGPKDVLEAASIPVKHELPGVGQHLQDHLGTIIGFNRTESTAGDIHAAGGSEVQDPKFMSFVNSATVYLDINTLFGNEAGAFHETIKDGRASSVNSPAASANSEVLAGYRAILNTLSTKILPTNNGAVEILLNTMFPGFVSVTAAVQSPFSHGRITVNSSSIHDPPVIDAGYLTHPADLAVLRQGVKFARNMGQLASLTDHLGAETGPGPAVSNDEQLDKWMVDTVATEYHPSSSCAMLPRNLGGVVNAKLQVYGTSNVRVIDGSVFPINFAAHLMAPIYGLAEIGSDIILAQYGSQRNPSAIDNDNSSSNNNANNNNTDSGKNSASISTPPTLLALLILSGLLASLL